MLRLDAAIVTRFRPRLTGKQTTAVILDPTRYSGGARISTPEVGALNSD